MTHLSCRCCSQWQNSSNLTAKYSHKMLDIDKPIAYLWQMPHAEAWDAPSKSTRTNSWAKLSWTRHHAKKQNCGKNRTHQQPLVAGAESKKCSWLIRNRNRNRGEDEVEDSRAERSPHRKQRLKTRNHKSMPSAVAASGGLQPKHRVDTSE